MNRTAVWSQRTRALPLWLALCAAVPGCSGAQTPPPAPAAKAAASGGDSACGEYARKLCVELGTRTDGCRSALGVVAVMPDSACSAGMADFETTRERIGELRKACVAVVDRVCAELGSESESCAAIRGDLPQIPPGHCAALLRDQERLLSVLRQRETLNAPIADAQWQALAAGSPPGFGVPDAKVVVVAFSDFQCPFCAEAARTIEKLKQEYGTRIRFVYRQFPLSFHKDARGAAQAALAAHDQGKFWEFHDRLFAHQDALSPAGLLEHARSAGLDLTAFNAAIAGSSTAERVDADVQLGESVRVQGTPTLFVDRRRVADPLDYDSVSQAVDAALGAKP
jgi:protein-disulfide isomerase